MCMDQGEIEGAPVTEAMAGQSLARIGGIPDDKVLRLHFRARHRWGWYCFCVLKEESAARCQVVPHVFVNVLMKLASGKLFPMKLNDERIDSTAHQPLRQKIS